MVTLVGECYVSYNRLLGGEPSIATINDREYEKHQVKVE